MSNAMRPEMMRQPGARAIPYGDTDTWVRETLEPGQLVNAKVQRYSRRQLGVGMHVLLWALRLYVVLMLIAVTVKFVTAIQTGGAGS